MHWANRDGIRHGALTLLFTLVGGLVSPGLAMRGAPTVSPTGG